MTISDASTNAYTHRGCCEKNRHPKDKIKKMKKISLLCAAMLCASGLYAQSTKIEIKTTLGDVEVMLYDDTPRHRDNFVKLASEGYYDGVLFHRVIKDFMVQTGDPNSKDSLSTVPLGVGSPDYTIEAEINYPEHYHKYGALAAARTNNPERRSSGSQFYIVTGRKFGREQVMDRALNGMRRGYVNDLIMKNEQELRALVASEGEAAARQRIAEWVRQSEEKFTQVPEVILETYETVGGTPHLDGEYTVFGEVLKGMDVVEKIQSMETDPSDRPVEDVRIISMKVEK